MLLVACFLATSRTAAQELSRLELHDRIVEAMARSAVLPPATDTSVSWQERGPVLYHLATRWADSITVGMQRNDPLFGTATVRFVAGRVHSASVRWNEGGTVQRAVEVEVRGDTVVVRDTARRAYPLPPGPWAVADYGMDDLFISAVRTLEPDREHVVSVLRPYGNKWDTVRIRMRAHEGGRVIESVGAPGDTTTFVVSDDGTLLQGSRSRNPKHERRPLEGTRAFALYLQRRLPNAP